MINCAQRLPASGSSWNNGQGRADIGFGFALTQQIPQKIGFHKWQIHGKDQIQL